jgi:pimeloyl-ACP methyl ester carboxylesterase
VHPAGTRRVGVNGITLNVVDHGEGSPLLLLHGFPDSAAVWRHVIPALAAEGFRVVAPDLRGFGDSDRPEGAGAYHVSILLKDAVGLLDALEIPSAQVVGHDWGAAVAWGMASLAPDRVERVAALSVGHPSGYFRSPRQQELSWYMLLFLWEGAEALLQKDDWAFVRTFMAGGDVDRYVRDLSRPGALTAALNYYRANITPASFVEAPPLLPPIRCPALGVWSDGDVACSEASMTSSEQFVEGPWRYERVEGANHWIPLTAADRLTALLLDFLVPG